MIVTFAISLVTALAAHPFHETLTQFEHNAHNGTLELALRIDAVDLEQMVERWLAERVNLETDVRAERSIELWLRERLSAQLSTGERAAFAWVGYEFDGAFCWIYVQFEVSPEAEWLDLAHIVLFDWHPSPTNTIVGLAKNSGQSYATTLEQPIARIRLTGEGETRIWWRVVIELAVAVWRAIQAQSRGI